MGKILSAYIMPHPPLIVPEVGKGKEAACSKTIQSLNQISLEISNYAPSTIIVITPHAPVFSDFIYISDSSKLKGNLRRFGAPQASMSFCNNLDLSESIINHSAAKGIPCGYVDNDLIRKYKLSKELDHGAFIPLYYINKVYQDFKLIHISIAGLPILDLYKFGMCMSEAVALSEENVVSIASGDLSHRLTKDAPYGYSDRSNEFDSVIVNSIKNSDVEILLKIDDELCESAGECGLRSFIITLGTLDGLHLDTDVLSYEGPFGVGYMVASLKPSFPSSEREFYRKINDAYSAEAAVYQKNEDPYVQLARTALEEYIKHKRNLKVPPVLPQELVTNRAGTFVSIKKHNRLRGCIGTIEPTRKNLAEEIIHNAINAGTQDPRFPEITEDELSHLVYSVDVLGTPEPVNSVDELDAVKYGVIVSSGRRRGLLLPNLDGVSSPDKQIEIALQKAGISSDEKYTLERFEVIRHT